MQEKVYTWLLQHAKALAVTGAIIVLVTAIFGWQYGSVSVKVESKDITFSFEAKR